MHAPYNASTLLPGTITISLNPNLQVGMLSLLWTLKSFKQTALFFPSVIGLLVVVRISVLPKLFSSKELSELDSPVG